MPRPAQRGKERKEKKERSGPLGSGIRE